MEKPLISVIIPAYNAAKRLDGCLESVCGQSWENLEIVVVDDGSTDTTAEIAQKWAEKDPRVRVIRKENGGVSSARNRGIEKCRGEWIRFVDADDVIPRDSIEKLYAKVERDGSDMVMAGYEHRVGTITLISNLANREDAISCDEYLHFLNKKANSLFCGVLWNKLFRRDIIEKGQIRFQSGLTFGEDFLFICEYLKYAEKVSFSRDTVYCYVRHPHSMTFGQTKDSILHPIRNIKVKTRLYRGMKQLYKDRGQYNKYFRRTLWMYMFRVTLNS